MKKIIYSIINGRGDTMNIPINELRTFKGTMDWYTEHGEGYRIVYFYPNDDYYVGPICKTIEGFMIEFCDEYPIMDEEDIPEFKSNDDLLSRYLNNLDDATSKAIDISNEKDLNIEKQLKEFIGHTPLQVLCGAILGIATAFIIMS